jgi:serine phosphatase RsbU (regulator of sigma subunit)
LQVAHEPAAAVRDHILSDVNAFCGDVPLFDDLTLVVVRYTG